MGFSVEYSGLAVVTHVLYKTALIFAVMRWVLSWAFRIIRGIDITCLLSFSSSSSSSSESLLLQSLSGPSSSSSSLFSSKMIRDNLVLTTFGDIAERVPESCDSTCAVCLDRLRMRDQVRELGNCSHVFHRRCLDRWLDHDTYKTCPLCRAPLLATMSTSSSPGLSQQQQPPSWAVERLLYLFGDDLLL